MAKKLTPIAIARLRSKPVRYEVSDGGTGLYVETRPTGGQSFISRYWWSGKPDKFVLGPVMSRDPRHKILPDLGAPTIGAPLNLEEARWLNALVRRQIANGIDPKGQRRKHGDDGFTVKAVSEEYLKRHGHLRSIDRRRYDFALVNAALGSRPIASVKVSDLVYLGDKIEADHGAAAADRVRANWQALANWHAGRVDDFRPPALRGAKRNKNGPRARILSDDEICRVWAAAETFTGPFGRYIQFLLLTAARRTEAAGMRRSELLDPKTWVIPASRVKTGCDTLVPLSTTAQKIIHNLPRVGDGDLVFTNDGRRAIGGFSDRKRELDAASGVTGWRIHDLRRTARTLLSRAGVNPDTAERCLGHVIGAVRKVYDRHAFRREKERAFEMLAKQIEQILHPGSKVVRLRRSRR